MGYFILPAQAKNLRADVERAAFRARIAQDAVAPRTPQKDLRPDEGTDSSREKAILSALKNEVLRPEKWETWGYFTREEQKIYSKQELVDQNAVRLIDHVYDSDCRLFGEMFGQSTAKASRPDYARETKNFKYIYMSDASSHETKTIPAEVIRVMRAVRRANPQARILLATEFAVQEDKDKLPFHFANSGKELPFKMIDYPQLVPVADQENIDVLGLDDKISPMKYTVKAGDTVIRFFLTDERVKRILTQYLPEEADNLLAYLQEDEEQRVSLEKDLAKMEKAIREYSKPIVAQALGRSTEELDTLLADTRATLARINEHEEKLLEYVHDSLRDFLLRSPWGTTQRNQQWARYIQAVSPFYDIVMVYVGNAHLAGIGVEPSLDALLAQKQIRFDFYTEEELPQHIKEAYEKAQQIQDRENGPIPNEDFREEVYEKIRSSYIGLDETVGSLTPGQPFFLKSSTLGMSQADRNEIGEICKQFSAPPPIPFVYFSVLLPEENP